MQASLLLVYDTIPEAYFSKLFFSNEERWFEYVGAYTAWDHMFIHVKWRDETEIPLVMLRTVLQDCKKGIGTFWIFQDFNASRFLNEIQRVMGC